MKATPRRDTSTELRLRALLHSRGLRYRVDYPVFGRRRADIVFTRVKLAVFVDGCFWHCCPDHGEVPAHNAEWWRAKLERTRARDVETTEALLSDGWTVMRVWEHEPPVAAATRVAIEAARLLSTR
jgi:DNA mismatch endonuclease (patch repair protein)